ncbi:uncharacterized protein LOC102787046 [Neolamprologus brichardi]|uniref:uncharacterized protein LOC102787046 n=1 Tax=Neolamprologus brichardi TaxID=32507 RepID=UPI0016438857|nr:uncharacterized protein LOC102787046 [Neolamprologus brichardi]
MVRKAGGPPWSQLTPADPNRYLSYPKSTNGTTEPHQAAHQPHRRGKTTPTPTFRVVWKTREQRAWGVQTHGSGEHGARTYWGRDKLVEEMRQNGEKMVKQASQFWRSLLTLLDPEHHQELVPTGSDLIFEPQTLGPGMSLSKDNRKVFHNSCLGQCCATLLICSTKTASSFQRWVVSLPEESDWTIGLCEKECVKNLKDGAVYGLCWEDKQLSFHTMENDDDSDASFKEGESNMANTAKQHMVSSELITNEEENGDEAMPPLEKVEVLWNFDASSLSFYSRTGQHQREEIITIEISLNNKELTPFVRLGKENVQNTTGNRLKTGQYVWLYLSGLLFLWKTSW